VIGNAPLLAAGWTHGGPADPGRDLAGLRDLASRHADAAQLADAGAARSCPCACLSENWLTERIRRSLGAGTYSTEMRDGAQVARPDPRSNAPQLFDLLEQLRALRATLATPVNRSLVLESLLRSLTV